MDHRMAAALVAPPRDSTDSPSSYRPKLANQDRNVRDACAVVPSVTSCDIPRRRNPAISQSKSSSNASLMPRIRRVVVYNCGRLGI